MEWLTEEFKQRVLTVNGTAGAEWLERLPGLVTEFEQRWGLSVVGPVGPLSYNFVALARRNDGSLAVLKLGAPSTGVLAEMSALTYFAGRGAARLLESDRQAEALLIEYVQPGHLLADLEDDERATEIAAGVMLRLWRPAPDDPALPRLEGYAEGYARMRGKFHGGSGPLPESLLSRAERLFAELSASAEQKMLMHGDLHHYNILEAGAGEWLAIDPFGLVGDPGYEVGAFLYNPIYVFPKRPHLGRLLGRRLDILSDRLGIERQRLVGWGIAQAVLSACWSLEDNEAGWEGTIRVGEALAAGC